MKKNLLSQLIDQVEVVLKHLPDADRDILNCYFRRRILLICSWIQQLFFLYQLLVRSYCCSSLKVWKQICFFLFTSSLVYTIVLWTYIVCQFQFSYIFLTESLLEVRIEKCTGSRGYIGKHITSKNISLSCCTNKTHQFNISLSSIVGIIGDKNGSRFSFTIPLANENT